MRSDIASPEALEFLDTWKANKSIWDSEFKSAIWLLNEKRIVLCVWSEPVTVGTPSGWVTFMELTPLGMKLLSAMRTYPQDRQIVIDIAHGQGAPSQKRTVAGVADSMPDRSQIALD